MLSLSNWPTCHGVILGISCYIHNSCSQHYSWYLNSGGIRRKEKRGEGKKRNLCRVKNRKLEE